MNVQKLADKILEKKAKEIRDEAKRLAPVDTGNLRDSIDCFKIVDYWYVGSPLSYAAMVEFGTIKMAAQPYLRPAIEKVKHA